MAGVGFSFAYIHGNIGAIHALSDDLAIVNKDATHWSLIRSECQFGLSSKMEVSKIPTWSIFGRRSDVLVGKRRTMLIASRMKASW
jgi:hypothetical protein